MKGCMILWINEQACGQFEKQTTLHLSYPATQLQLQYTWESASCCKINQHNSMFQNFPILFAQWYLLKVYCYGSLTVTYRTRGLNGIAKAPDTAKKFNAVSREVSSNKHIKYRLLTQNYYFQQVTDALMAGIKITAEELKIRCVTKFNKSFKYYSTDFHI